MGQEATSIRFFGFRAIPHSRSLLLRHCALERIGGAVDEERDGVGRDGWNAQDLPRPTRDLDQAKSDPDRVGICLLADALDVGRTAAT